MTLMACRFLSIPAAASLTLIVACATPPPPPPPVVPFETKMSWILRLEDQRILRDPAAAVPVPPAPPPKSGRRTVIVEPPPLPDLVRLLTDGEARIRRRAALAVGRVGLAEAVPALVRVLQTDADPEVRQMAAFALGLIGDASAAEPLRGALGDPLPLIAGRAAEALGLIGDAGSAPAIAKMVAAHAGAAAAVAPDEARVQATEAADAFRLGVYALARLKNYDGLAASVLGPNGRPTVQWWPVAYALQRVEDARAAPALLALAAHESPYTKAFAIKGLGQLREAAAVPLLVALIDPARTAAPATIEAIRAAGRIGDDRATAPLLKLLYTRDMTPTVRAETLLALAKTGGEVSSEAFVDFVGDRSPAVRLAALQGLAERDEDAFLLVLSGLDPDPHYSVRAGLATLLATKDPERALPRVAPMLADQDARVVPAVLAAMAKLRAPDVGRVLVDHLAKEDVGIRAAAAAALGEIKPDGGVEALVAAYKRGESDLVIDTRAAALEALSKYGAAAAMPTLKAALADKDWALRVKAAELIGPLDPSIDAVQAIRPAPPAANGVDYASAGLVDPPVSPQVYIETEKGTIQIELDVLDAPITALNFMTLARRGYFDGLTFHRLVANFVAQSGDPRGDGEGGPGYSIRDELNQEPYLRGTVGMALAWRDTGGSQFFITHSPQPHLDARYTVFGRVIAGMEIVDALNQWDVMTRVRVWDGKQ